MPSNPIATALAPREFQARHTPPPKQATQSSPANEFVDRLRSLLLWHEHTLKLEKKCRMVFAGAFGILKARQISVAGNEIVQITASDEDGIESEIVTHVSQCSIRFEIFSPTTEAERTERPFIGFTPTQEKGPGSA